jgi:hypothetical protein
MDGKSIFLNGVDLRGRGDFSSKKPAKRAGKNPAKAGAYPLNLFVFPGGFPPWGLIFWGNG